jgi:uncharacterized membrane protein
VLLALPIWTLLIWATRIRIILSDDGSIVALIVPVVLTALAIAALFERRRGLMSLAAATMAVWLVRLPLVLLHDHSIGFKLVHGALAAVSIWLAVGAWRALRQRRLWLARSVSPTRRSSAPS